MSQREVELKALRCALRDTPSVYTPEIEDRAVALAAHLKIPQIRELAQLLADIQRHKRAEP